MISRLLADELPADFVEHFVSNIFSEPHSTKQIEDGICGPATPTMPVPSRRRWRHAPSRRASTSARRCFARSSAPCCSFTVMTTGSQPYARAQAVAEVTGGELVTIPGGGRDPLGRFPAKCNVVISDFIDRKLHQAVRPTGGGRPGRARKFSICHRPSAWGMRARHRRRSGTAEMRPDLHIHWLAQDPVTRLLAASGECVHPLSARLASRAQHIELESGDHELHAFQAIRRMDELLIANFMIFQDAVEQGEYDLVIGDKLRMPTTTGTEPNSRKPSSRG